MMRQPAARHHRLRWAVVSLLVLTIALFGWRWANAPNPPDVRTGNLGPVIGYMGTEDFGRMYTQARADYASGVMDRLAAVALEAFYRRPPQQREMILCWVARSQRDASSTRSLARLDARFKHVVARQPLRVQGMIAQFVLDLRRQREAIKSEIGSRAES